MSMIVTEILIILFLLLLNGFFALSEIAIISSSKPLLRQMARQGNRRAATALKLSEDSGRFLSTVQVGITLVGIIAGAYGGATIAEDLEGPFNAIAFINPHGETVAVILVVTLLTYFSVIIGELIPKQIALANPEKFAMRVARPMAALLTICAPIVVILERSANLLSRVLGIRHSGEDHVTEDEVRAVIAEGASSGALQPEEQAILERIMRLDDYDISVIMTHRRDIVWLDAATSLATVIETVERTRHSHYLVGNGSLDQLLGVVTLKDLFLQIGRGQPFNLDSITRKPLSLSASVTILNALEEFKQSTANHAILVDEAGALQGVVTLKDMLEALVGILPEPAYREDFSGEMREDGSWLLDGGMSVFKAEEFLGIDSLNARGGNMKTLAGFVLAHNKNIPKPGDHFIWNNWRFEVVDMDRQRVDKVLAQPVAADDTTD